MSSSGSSSALLARVRAALAEGNAEQPDLEAAFVADQLRDGRFDLDQVLAQLAVGVSPYQVFGLFPVPGTPHHLEVWPQVMPPGSVTPAVIDVIRTVCSTIRPAVVLDLGCGTGVLGIAALLTEPRMEGILVDLDPNAAACTRGNLARLGLADRAVVVCADAGATAAGRAVDLIVANPPFVPDEEIGGLPARFRDHAPRQAVRGGGDGLDILRSMVAAINGAARPGCHLVLQHGDGQRRTAASILAGQWTPADLDAHPNVAVFTSNLHPVA